MSTNNDNQTQLSIVPKWVEAKLFEGTIKEVEPEFKEIKEFKIEPALAPGENYASLMLKVEFVISLNDGSLKPLSFMFKVGHDTDSYREMIKSYNAFDIETGMYRDLVPELEQILMEAGVHVRFGAKSYTLPTTEPYILMENLKYKGFRNANRLEGLDMRHAESVLKKLAQWHAASAVRVVRNGNYPDKYSKSQYRPECYDMVKGMYSNTTSMLLECVGQFSNSDLYYDKVEKIQPQIFDEIFKLMAKTDDKDDNAFRVLNHGDTWSNNIMFRYDNNSNELLDTYFVDYQVPSYNSPAQDLWYFIMSSCKIDIKLSKFDYMISYYHKHLQYHLKLLKYPKAIPSIRDIHCQLYENGMWAYVTLTNVLCGVLLDPTDTANLENLMGASDDGSAFKRQLYSNTRYRQQMESILPWLLNKGLLEV
uniref:CHK kinase-like domain-containing protein n=1 Tax=Stomoxys calcitrans TaxID=35570 RepID=A0A1I8PC14_STOCA